MIRDTQKIRICNLILLQCNPNINPDYPEDSPNKMQELHQNKHIPFEYLIDENQRIANEFKATCTPDFYLLNEQMNNIWCL